MAVRPRCACGWFLHDATPILGLTHGAGGGPFVAAVRGGCRRHGWVETQDCTDWDYWFEGSIDPLDQPVAEIPS